MNRLRKNILLAALLALTASGALARTVRGTVVDSGRRPLKGAVVQIKDLKTLAIRSFVCKDDGSFRFTGLSPEIDYEVKSSYDGHWSGKKTVSRFDSHPTVEIVLTIALPE